MSTTAMQAAGQHIPASTYSTTPNTRSYAQSRPSHDEVYYSSQDAPNSSSTQSSRQYRRNPTTQSMSPQNDTYLVEDRDYGRHAFSQQGTVNLPSHTRNQSAPVDRYDGTGPVPPPRISSQHSSPPVASESSRHARHNTERSVGQNTTPSRSYDTGAQDRPREDTSVPAATAARSRRKGPASPEGQSNSISNRDYDQSYQDRVQTEPSHSGAPAPLVREYSEVINRVVVSDPNVDIERMQERLAEAQPGPGIGGLSQTTLGLEEEPARALQKRQDYSKQTRRKDVQFGDYVLGQTLGEGEFGKVKLGWKKDGSTQVAIKLIRRESVATNPTRLPKIYREISILRDLAHPNIVRLHEMVETERYIGIILEYASGGELFDYILNQRYLKDPSARRLFAQLVSGVGYLHKKGIVHRDLKLENLLLDQNKNIIITDFGFANTFNPGDELSPELEYNLTSKDFVRKYKLDRVDANGMRKGDLMQTSCGSPCYAAPELVVSDSLYTGRKVDVWSCGVILYAMLAGYLPFDDDPANPEGDNINLLYKYITTTQLTFPEYVSPHARDLLRRILVPDPRKRADLFEVARHSWLNEYHHVVAHITSSTTNIADIANSTVPAEGQDEVTAMPRSASVRLPKATPPSKVPQSAGRTQMGYVEESNPTKRDRTARHTLQPEYVAPRTETARVDVAEQPVRRVEQPATSAGPSSNHPQKQLPPDPPRESTGYQQTAQTSGSQQTRPARDVPRTMSDQTGAYVTSGVTHSVPQYATRPSTQGSMASGAGLATTRSDLRLPSRGSYGQPVAPTVAATNVQGKVTQPTKNSRGYNISGPLPQHGHNASLGQPMAPPPLPDQQKPAHHRRSSTLSNLGERLFGRSNSVHRKDDARQKSSRKYPPTAMKDNYSSEPQSRMSVDSKRSFSFGLRKKESADLDGQDEKPRRFSLVPSSMSFKSLLGGKGDQSSEYQPQSLTSSQQSNHPPMNQNYPPGTGDSQQERRVNNFSRPPQAQQRHAYYSSTPDVYGGTGVYDANVPQSQSQGLVGHQRQSSRQDFQQYSDGYDSRPSMQQNRPNRNVLTKPNRRFNDPYDQEGGSHASSSAVRKVQDFFRRRGRARIDSDYR